MAVLRKVSVTADEGSYMKILAVDDEKLALEMLTEAIQDACPDAEILGFSNPYDCLEEAQKGVFDVVMTDIQMPQMTGLEFAEKLLKIRPGVNIIFITAYDSHAVEAMRLHASGYILKPVTAKKIEKELGDLRYHVEAQEEYRCRIQCYGNFEVFDRQGFPVHFRRNRSKEALAYIVHRRGASCTTREIAAVLFEDLAYDKQQMNYLKKIMSSLVQDLEANGIGDIIVRQRGNIACNPDKCNCDYFNNPEKKDDLDQEYMTQYSWAEYE